MRSTRRASVLIVVTGVLLLSAWPIIPSILRQQDIFAESFIGFSSWFLFAVTAFAVVLHCCLLQYRTYTDSTAHSKAAPLPAVKYDEQDVVQEYGESKHAAAEKEQLSAEIKRTAEEKEEPAVKSTTPGKGEQPAAETKHTAEQGEQPHEESTDIATQREESTTETTHPAAQREQLATQSTHTAARKEHHITQSTHTASQREQLAAESTLTASQTEQLAIQSTLAEAKGEQLAAESTHTAAQREQPATVTVLSSKEREQPYAPAAPVAAAPPVIVTPPAPIIITKPLPGPIISHLSNLQASTAADDLAKYMYLTAEQAIENAANLEVFLQQRGTSVVLGALMQLEQQLMDHSCVSGVAAAILQASWIMLLVANSSVLNQIAALEQTGLNVPLKVLELLDQAPLFPPEVKSTMYRNACWAMSLLLDTLHDVDDDTDVTKLRRIVMLSMQQQLNLDSLGELLSLAYGPDAALQAALLLSWFAQQHTKYSGFAQAAQEVIMSDAGLHGFCNVLHMDMPQPKLRTVLQGFLNQVVSQQPERFLRAVVIEHLLLFYVTGMSAEARSRFVLFVISSKGEEVLQQIEDEFDVDAALALAQLIPADCHFIQRAAPPESTAADVMEEIAEIEPADSDDEQDAGPSDLEEHPAGEHGTCTCAMCCRAMLSRDRIKELVGAFLDEWQDEYEERMQTGVVQPPSELAVAFTGLAAYLTSNEVDIAADQHYTPNHTNHMQVEKDKCACSTTIEPGTPGTSACAACSTGIKDEMQCHCWNGACPAASRQGVEFVVGRQMITVCMDTYEKLQKASSFLESVLLIIDEEDEGSITIMAVPGFSEDMNVWAFKCLLEWVCRNNITQLQPMRALDLWKAADFFQMDQLQLFCERVAYSNFHTPEVLAAAVHLSIRSHLSGTRLLRSCCLHILRDLQRLMYSPHLDALLSHYREDLEPQVVQVLQGRLVTIVTMNGGLGLPLPNVENAVSPS